MSRTARPFGCGPAPSLDQASAAGPASDCRSACWLSPSMRAAGGSACVPSKWGRTMGTFSLRDPPRP
eukprot:15460245-Alexandrium_andersonii.AAC.1